MGLGGGRGALDGGGAHDKGVGLSLDWEGVGARGGVAWRQMGTELAGRGGILRVVGGRILCRWGRGLLGDEGVASRM